MRTPIRLAAAVAVVVVISYGALNVLRPNTGTGALPSASTAPTALTPTALASPTLAPLDTSSWFLYVSRWNWLGVQYPRGWTAIDADHAWSLNTDAAWPNTAADRYVSPDGRVTAASWSVVVEPGTDLLAWIDAYCSLNTSPCTGIQDRAVPVIADDKLHVSGLLIPFNGNVQAFFLDVDRIYVVAVWKPDSDPGLAQFGGGRRLVEAMSASMCFTCAYPNGSTPRPG
ncbi:MAG TPA: hypothetical protein VGM49_03775 [Candidatus Limnocylindrales bacterium]